MKYFWIGLFIGHQVQAFARENTSGGIDEAILRRRGDQPPAPDPEEDPILLAKQLIRQGRLGAGQTQSNSASRPDWTIRRVRSANIGDQEATSRRTDPPQALDELIRQNIASAAKPKTSTSPAHVSSAPASRFASPEKLKPSPLSHRGALSPTKPPLTAGPSIGPPPRRLLAPGQLVGPPPQRLDVGRGKSNLGEPSRPIAPLVRSGSSRSPSTQPPSAGSAAGPSRQVESWQAGEIRKVKMLGSPIPPAQTESRSGSPRGSSSSRSGSPVSQKKGKR